MAQYSVSGQRRFDELKQHARELYQNYSHYELNQEVTPIIHDIRDYAASIGIGLGALVGSALFIASVLRPGDDPVTAFCGGVCLAFVSILSGGGIGDALAASHLDGSVNRDNPSSLREFLSEQYALRNSRKETLLNSR